MKKQAYEDERKLKYKFDENGNIIGLNPEYVTSKNKTPEQRALEEQQKADYKQQLQNAGRYISHCWSQRSVAPKLWWIFLTVLTATGPPASLPGRM